MRAGHLSLAACTNCCHGDGPSVKVHTHKHCITQCISVEPPSSSLRPSPLLVSLSALSRLHLPYRRKRYWNKRSSPTNHREKVLLQLYKEGLCSGVDLSVEWTVLGGRRGDRVHEEGDEVTGYTRRREKTEANNHSLCVVFMTEGDYSCVVFHSTVY